MTGSVEVRGANIDELRNAAIELLQNLLGPSTDFIFDFTLDKISPNLRDGAGNICQWWAVADFEVWKPEGESEHEDHE
jgi:hypothetical protein